MAFLPSAFAGISFDCCCSQKSQIIFEKAIIFYANTAHLVFKLCQRLGKFMEDGGIYTTVIDSRQCKMGQMINFSTIWALSVFGL